MPTKRDRAFLDQLVQLQDVVAGDAEDVLDPQCSRALDQVFADRDWQDRPVASPSLDPCCAMLLCEVFAMIVSFTESNQLP